MKKEKEMNPYTKFKKEKQAEWAVSAPQSGKYNLVYGGIDFEGNAKQVGIGSLRGYTGANNSSAVFLTLSDLVKKDTEDLFRAAGFEEDLEVIEKNISIILQESLNLNNSLDPKITDVDLSQALGNVEQAVFLEREARESYMKDFAGWENLSNNLLSFYADRVSLSDQGIIKFNEKIRNIKSLNKYSDMAQVFTGGISPIFGELIEKSAMTLADRVYKKFLQGALKENLQSFSIAETARKKDLYSKKNTKGDYFTEFSVRAGENSEEISFRFGTSLKGSRSKSSYGWSIGSTSFNTIAKKFLFLKEVTDLNSEVFGGNDFIVKKEVPGKQRKTLGLNLEKFNSKEQQYFFTTLLADIIFFGYGENRPLLKENWIVSPTGKDLPEIKIEFLYKILHKLSSGGFSIELESNSLGFRASISKNV